MKRNSNHSSKVMPFPLLLKIIVCLSSAILLGTRAYGQGIQKNPDTSSGCHGVQIEYTFLYSGPGYVQGITWRVDPSYAATISNGSAQTTNVTWVSDGTLTVEYYEIINGVGTSHSTPTSFDVSGPLTVSISPSSEVAVCSGSSITLTAAGSGPYEWTGPGITDPSQSQITVSPTSQSTYTVIGKNPLCNYGESASVTVDVLLPALPPSDLNLTYCEWEYPVLKSAGLHGKFNWYEVDGTPLGSGLTWTLDYLKGGTYQYKFEAVSDEGCASTSRKNVNVTINSNCDNKLNWMETISYDENEAIYSQSKSYYDLSGKSLQSQSKQFTREGNIFASQYLRDRYDRAIGSTMSAPIQGTEFKYNHFFVENESSERYSDKNFDDPAGNSVIQPHPVGDNTQGTLGWYYSDNNSLEDHVPTTRYPYSRTEFYEDGTGEVKRSASPGDQHRLGMGHEILTGTFPVYSELDDYIAKRRLGGLPDQLSDNTLKNKGVQTVVRDENGKYAIGITDKSGKTAMSARKGTAGDNVLSITNQVSSNLDLSSPDYRPLTYLYILDDQAITITPGASTSYSIEDLVSGSEYSPPTSGVWAAGFYRIILNSGSISFNYTNYYLDVSYLFYDDAGRLKYSVSPNGYQQWKTGSSFNVIDKTSYEYNHRGWLLAMTEPDAGRTEYVYRRDGKIRFSENAQQRIENHFSYTHYDQLGRPVESGEYVGTDVAFKSVTMMTMLEYDPERVLWSGNEVRDWVKTHYDEMDPALAAEQTYQTFVRGGVSWTENKYSKTWYFYDELGRVKTMMQRIPMANNMEVMNHYAYDFLGNIRLMIHQPSQGNSFYYGYFYDKDKRLKRVDFNDASQGISKTVASYEYYLHGPLKRIELGDKLQGIDFVYNINGWLTQINHPDTNNDPGGDGNAGDHADFRKDVFGMLLDYYESQMGVFQGAYHSPKYDPNRFHKLPDALYENNGNLNAFVPSPSLQHAPHVMQGLQQIKDAIEKTEQKGEVKKTIGKISGGADKDENTILPFNDRIDPNTLIASSGNGIYTTPAVIYEGNGILNGEFDQGTSDWAFTDTTPGGGNTFSVVQNAGLSGTNAAYVNVSNASNEAWRLQLRQTLSSPLEIGKTYEISFIARAESPRIIQPAFTGSPSNAEYWKTTVSLTTVNQVYGPFQYTCNNANANSDASFFLRFYLAQGAISDVWIDKVIIVDKTGGSGAVAGVNISPLATTLAVGQSTLLAKTILPTNAINQNVTWLSDNTSIATVNSNGLVTAVSSGTAVITATSGDGSHTASSVINVLPAGSNNIKNPEFDEAVSNWSLSDWSSGGGNTLSIVQDGGLSGTNSAYVNIVNTDNSNHNIQLRQTLDSRLEVGKTYEISFIARAESPRQIQPVLQGSPSNIVYWNTSVNVTTEAQVFGPFQYTCNNSNVSSESSFGFKFFLAKGVISDVWIDKVIVVDKTSGTGIVAGVNVTPLNGTIAVGQSMLLTKSILPTNATNQNVTWSSGNTAVATVNNVGLVTAVSAGSATITATTADGGYTGSSSVTVLPFGGNPVRNNEFDEGKNHWTFYDWSGPSNTNGGNIFSIVQGAGLSGNNAAYVDIVNTNSTNWTIQLRNDFDFELEQGRTYEVSFMAKAESPRSMDVSIRGDNLGGTFWAQTVNLTTASQTFGPFLFTCNDPNVSNETVFKIIFYLAKGILSDVWLDNLSVRDITQSPGSVAGVTVSPATVTLAAGQSKRLFHTIFPADATNQNVTWTSSNPSVATVTNSGWVTGVASGSATITATTLDGSFTASSSFTVLPAGSNTLKNHEFDNDKSYWRLQDWTGPNNSNGGNTFSIVQGAGLSGNNAAFIDVVSNNSSGWTLQLQQDLDFELEQGHTYEISFTSKAESSRPLEVALRGSSGDYWDEDVNLTTTSQTFGPFLYTCNDAGVLTEPGLFGIVFYLSKGIVSDVWIDNVIVKDVTGTPGAVIGVNVSPLAVALAAGQSKKLTHAVFPPDASNLNVTWSSSNPSVATVNDSGFVTAVSAGTSTITVTTVDGGLTASSSFTVLPTASNTLKNHEFDNDRSFWTLYDWTGPNNSNGGNTFSVVQGAGLSGNNAAYIDIVNNSSSGWTLQFQQHLDFELQQGHTYEVSFTSKAESSRPLEAALRGANGNYWNVNVNLTTVSQTFGPFLYTCNNPGVLTDPGFAVVFYLAKGVISDVWIDNVVVKDVTVIPVSGITISPASLTLTVGHSSQLTKSILPLNATNQEVTWSSSNANIATVSSDGLVTAVAPGQVDISVITADGMFTAVSVITVHAPVVSVTGLNLSHNYLPLDMGQSFQLLATVLPANATNQEVTWSSDNLSIATVSSGGLVTGVAQGTAIIMATTVDGGFTASTTLNVGAASSAFADIKPLYNGIISSVTWRTDKAYQSTEGDFSGTYFYDYDEKYQIKEANFAKPTFGTLPGYTMQGNQFRLTGMSYDPNGNIMSLKRYNDQELRINDFTYHYQNSFAPGYGWESGAQQMNRLMSVYGHAPSYEYNAIGQMICQSTNSQYVSVPFATGAGLEGGEVHNATLQPDGKILLGGNFTSYNGEQSVRIVRLHQDGSKDATLLTGTGFNSKVDKTFVQPDGKIIVGGTFTEYDGATAIRITRLNQDGSIDNSFTTGTGLGAGGGVTWISLQPDGKVLFAGAFTSYNGTSINRILRLNADGTIDGSFITGTGFNGTTNCVQVQPNGKILASGSFTSYNGTPANRIIRLNSDGSIDNTFVYGAGFSAGYVEVMLLQSDGKIVAVGQFATYKGTPSSGIVRILPDGSIDPSFTPGTGFNAFVRDAEIQADGKIVAGGDFTMYNGVSANYVIRLNSDGTVDESFDSGTGANSLVIQALMLQNSKILLAGYFTSYNGTTANRVVLLNTDGSISTTNSSSSGETSYQAVKYDVTGKVKEVYKGTAPISSTPPGNPGGGGPPPGGGPQPPPNPDGDPDLEIPDGYALNVSYLYDDRGFRLAKVNHETQRTTWYIRDASGNILSVYEQEGVVNEETPNTNELVQTEIPVYGSGKIGTYYPQQDGSLVYELTDHLGNVRALLRENVSIYTATVEDNGQEEITNPRVEEMQYFENIFETEVADTRMNYTSPTAEVPNPDKSAYLYWVDGMAGIEATDKSIGPAIALKVNAGDKVQMETWVRYEEKVSYEGLDLTALASMLGGTFMNVKGFEGYTQTQTSSSLLGAFNAAELHDDEDNARPSAFLNYIVYDNEMVYQDAGWVQVSEDAGFEPGSEGAPNSRLHKRLKFNTPVEINQNGYIYIWVSNQSEATKVWFDDLKVTHTQQLVTQATDYGVWGDVLREQKSDESQYRYGYQGQYSERDEETNWNHFDLREYDPVIGRTTTTDPARQFHSPYMWVGNNPISGIDPTGGVSPIYDLDGNFLGTDDQGLQGEAIFMHASQFTQGMSHANALEAGFTFSQFHFFDINLEASAQAFTHMEGLSNRPDWDGIVTDMEARDWWRNGKGEPLFVNTGLIDLTPVNTGTFNAKNPRTYNFFFDRTSSETTGRVYGTLTLKLINVHTGEVAILRNSRSGFIDTYDFNPDGRVLRDIATWGARRIVGEGTAFGFIPYGANPRVNVKP